MDPKNILVRMPNWIGDLVMATPVLSDLRAAFPGASVTAMCQSPLAALLEEDASIDELFSFQRPSNSFLRREERRNIIEKIRAGSYDLGVLLTNSFSSAWWFWQGGVKRRIGYPLHWRRFLLTDRIDLPKEPMHQVDWYKNILEPLGIVRSNTAPRLFLLPKELKASKELLYQRGVLRGKRLVGIHPGAAYGSAKCWPPERFRSLALRLLKEEDLFIVFFGDLGSKELIREISQGLDSRVINLAGVTQLRELACLIHGLDLFITNDSGPMHIAAAFDIPLIALFGSTDDRLTGPFGKGDAVIHQRVSCSPCFRRTCPIDFRCMKQITVEDVAEKALAQLKRGRLV